MKKESKNQNKLIIFLIFLTIFVVGGVIFILNKYSNDSSLTAMEKKWITENNSKVINVSTYNDVPVFGMGGSGVIFDLIDDISLEYGINFNKISYLTDNTSSNYQDVAFKVVDSSYNLTDNDILMYRDSYGLYSREQVHFNNIRDINNAVIGVLQEDSEQVSYIVGDNNIEYKVYDEVDALVEAMVTKEEVSYIVLPTNLQRIVILENDLNIVYNFSDLYKQYILTVNDDTVLGIIKKYYNVFKEEDFDESYRTNYLELFFTAKGITEQEKTDYNNKTYTFGYVVNMPYTNINSDEFVGTFSNYLKGFEKLADVDFKIVRYDNIKELKEAFLKGNIDFALADFDTSVFDREKVMTIPVFQQEYVILAKDYFKIDSIRGLKNYTVSVIKDSGLYEYALDNEIEVSSYENSDELLINVSDDSIVLVSLDTYTYYKDKKLVDYKVILEEAIDANYSIIVNNSSSNVTFASLLNSYVSSVNYKDYRYVTNTSDEAFDSYYFRNMFKYIVSMLVILLVLILVLWVVRRKKKKSKLISRDDKMKFIDIMTSLKNRNYLNYNMENWSHNPNYPQAVVVVDLNNIKYINDNHGHEEGDRVIKEAANVLINSQLENTDIIRTSGNEFLIYMVGYDEKQVITYCRKLFKDLKELPYNFGATLGQSMILNEVKTLDDAINEATIEMRKAKEKLNKND